MLSSRPESHLLLLGAIPSFCDYNCQPSMDTSREDKIDERLSSILDVSAVQAFARLMES